MNVVAMCTLTTGLSALRFALDMGVEITKVIGLDDVYNRDKNAISGIVDISEFCIANDLEFEYVSDYSLKQESSEVLGCDVDLYGSVVGSGCYQMRLLSQLISPLSAHTEVATAY